MFCDCFGKQLTYKNIV